MLVEGQHSLQTREKSFFLDFCLACRPSTSQNSTCCLSQHEFKKPSFLKYFLSICNLHSGEHGLGLGFPVSLEKKDDGKNGGAAGRMGLQGREEGRMEARRHRALKTYSKGSFFLPFGHKSSSTEEAVKTLSCPLSNGVATLTVLNYTSIPQD